MLRLTVLGSGAPTPTPDRFGSSYVLHLGDERIMVDCGPATTHKLVKAGLWHTDIDYLFFTHHHFDHDVDYPCFLLTCWDQDIGQANRLQVFGPSPTEKLTKDLICEDGACRRMTWGLGAMPPNETLLGGWEGKLTWSGAPSS